MHPYFFAYRTPKKLVIVFREGQNGGKKNEEK